MSVIIKELRNPKERIYQFLVFAFGILIWVGIAAFIFKAIMRGDHGAIRLIVLYVIGIPAFILISAALYRAQAFGNMVLLGPGQCEELYQMVVDGAREIGLPQPPRTFLYNSNGVMNAFARRLLGARYVFLTSALVEVQDDAQIRFVIGHELGHHAAGHLDPFPNIIKMPGYFVPFLGPAYSRAREYTCDNIGAYLSKDSQAARSSLLMLGCGCRRLSGTLNCESFIDQEKMVPKFFGFVREILRGHPRLTRRVKAIKDYV